MANIIKSKKQFGTWPAAITKQTVVSNALRFGSLQADGAFLYWSEGRPEQAGRSVIMRWSEQTGIEELLPEPFSARSKVHEYGGGEFCAKDDKLFFVNAKDQQIYQLETKQQPLKITDAVGFRFADIIYDTKTNRLIAIAEKHAVNSKEDTGHSLPENMLVNIGVSEEERGGISVLSDSHDFYSSPVLNEKGDKLAWLQWNLPDMPWDAAELVMSPYSDKSLSPKYIAGGRQKDSRENSRSSACFQPAWHADDNLYFISDKTDNGQLYFWQNGKINLVEHQNGHADAFRPQWVFGMGAYTICKSAEETQIYVSSYIKGKINLEKITHQSAETITTTATSIECPVNLSANNNQPPLIAAIVTTDHASPSVTIINPQTSELKPIRNGSDIDLDGEDISKGEIKSFQVANKKTYGLYYPPANANYEGPDDSLPPAIITIHGGPTAMAARGLKLKTQYWTNRGYAVFDVDYGGSTGYGKKYRERLTSGWGEKDVEDIIAAADYLCEQKLADPEKLIISGGSSGGFTCLMALVKSERFKCASCNYPVTDLAQLLEITHKFELGYTYSLTGTTELNAKQKLAEKSVIANIDQINTPVIFFQGEEDKVVPPSQPEAVYNALRQRDIPTKLVTFANEGHGFRQSETIIVVLSEEEEFFKKSLKI